jgi:hypothetical protein
MDVNKITYVFCPATEFTAVRLVGERGRVVCECCGGRALSASRLRRRGRQTHGQQGGQQSWEVQSQEI